MFPLITVICSIALAAEYYLAPDGSDDNSGSRAQPWRSLTRANAAAQPGDVVTFLPGSYDGTLTPANSGTPEAPITFRSSEPLGAVLTGIQDGPVMVLNSKQHVVIEGFHMLPTRGHWGTVRNCEGVVLRRCKLEGTRVGYSGLRIERCKRCRIEGNQFTRQLLLTNDVILDGDMLTIEDCDRTVVVGNDFSKAGHGPANWLLTTYDVVRGNCFHAHWGRLFALFNCQPILFEDNVILDNYHGSGSADAGSKILVIDGIVRHNLVVRNSDYVIHSFNYKYGDYPPWVLQQTRIYHNTFASNASFAWGVGAWGGDPAAISGNVWKNNIFAGHTPGADGRTFLIDTPIGSGNRWVCNLIYGVGPGNKTIARRAPGRGLVGYSLQEAEGVFSEEMHGNLDLPPEFLDPQADNYALQPTSPAVDRGEPLAVAEQDGNGTELKVSDARWFYDGFGIEGEQGDLVMVGPEKQIARVVAVDRNANRLTLDRPLRWRKGDSVTLPYAGAAPDLGALERDAEREAWYHRVAIPPGLRWEPPTDPQVPLVRTSFEDQDVEEWAYQWWWGWFSLPGYVLPRRVRDTAAQGQCSVRMMAENDNVALETTIAPRGWDIDRHPWIRFWYRIPPGVPIGMRLEAFPASVTYGERVMFVGGSPACLAATSPKGSHYTLVDDDQWHQITLDARAIRESYPDVKTLYQFRFFSPVKWQRGWQVWLDEFEIVGHQTANQ